MRIVEAGTLAKTTEGGVITGIVISATKEEISSLPFNPYGAFVKLVKVDQPKKAEPPKPEKPTAPVAKGKGK